MANGTRGREKYVCYQNVTLVSEMLNNSRYWIEGVAIFFVTVVGLLGKAPIFITTSFAYHSLLLLISQQS